MPLFLTSAEGYAIADERHFPVVLARFEGFADEEMLGKFFEWMEIQHQRAKDEGTRLAMVVDLSRALVPPGPVKVKAATLHEAMRQRHPEIVMGGFLVIHSGLMRGAVTAINWIAHNKLPIVTRARLDEAIDAALQALRSAGIVPPLALVEGSYRFPLADPNSRRPPSTSVSRWSSKSN